MKLNKPWLRVILKAILYVLFAWLAVCVLVVLFGLGTFILAHRLVFGVLTAILSALVLASYLFTRRQ